MDVEPATSATAAGEGGAATATSSRSIKMHPLAIIGISDHHTRVVTGGSALRTSAPVVGLLFGYYHSADGSGGSGEFLKNDDGSGDIFAKQEIWMLGFGRKVRFQICFA